MNQHISYSSPNRHASGWFATLLATLIMASTTARATYQSTVLADNPVAFYALNPASDPANTTPDLTGNGNNGLAVGTVSATGPSPYITNAAFFSGASAIDLSQGANPALLNFLGPITLEAWAQPSSSSLFGDIVAKGYDSMNYNEIVIRVNGPYGANYFGSSGTTGVNGGSQTTNWTYIVLSSDGTNCTLYENGIQVAQSADKSGSVTNFPAGNDDWMIGNGSSAGNSRLFNGNISEVAIYNHGLSAAQVLNHYYVGLLNSSPMTSAPILNTQPQSQASFVGGAVTFSVVAVSALPDTNQWYYNGNPLDGQTNSTLTLANLQTVNAGNYSVTVGNVNGATNSDLANLTIAIPRSLAWSYDGGANNGTWDSSGTANWLDLSGGVETVFNPGDAVLFDDTPGVPTAVTVSGTVVPSQLTVNSTNNAFTLSGGAIGGSGGLVKEGPSVLTLTSGGGLAGPVSLSGGAIYAGNNCLDSVASITITNAATLDFAGGQIQGHQPVVVSGSGLNGEGALFNSYNNYPSEILDIWLAGDTSFGGTARWDLGAGSQINGAHNLTLDWSADSADGYYGQWTSVQIGAGVAGLFLTNALSGSVTTALGLNGMDAACQNPATLLTVGASCQLLFYSGGFNGSLHLLSGAQLYHYSAPAGFSGGTITLESNASFISYYNGGATTPVNSAIILNGVAHFVTGDHAMVYTNVLSGPGGFVDDYYNNNMVFSASNTYSGPTIIGSIGNSPEVALTGAGSISRSALIFFGGTNPAVAHLDVSGRTDDTLTLASGQTLAGIGGLNGNLVVAPGATLAPAGTNTTLGITTGASPVGELAASGGISLNGTTVIKLDGLTNDLVAAAAGVTYGGALNLLNISGSPLAAGDTFQIFSAATYAGSFATITPATPGPGLAWNTNQLGRGLISVAATAPPVIASTKLAGASLVITGSGGTPNHTYYLLAAPSLPAATWTPVATNLFDASGNFNTTNPVNPNSPQQFFRIK